MALSPSGTITLLTDFGTSDPFVGVMKGVILTRFAAAQLVDLTHEIAPQAIVPAAWWLARSARYFPPGTVHLAVVDPTVGSARKPCVMQTDEHWFVGPCNGLFDEVAHAAAGVTVREIDAKRALPDGLSATFHGRDLFAPIAAGLAAGMLSFEEVGPQLHHAPSPQLPTPTHDPSGAYLGHVLFADRFGNLFTNLEAHHVQRVPEPVVRIGAVTLPLGRTYSDVAPGQLAAHLNSFGVVEVALRGGNAQEVLGLGSGASLHLVPGRSLRGDGPGMPSTDGQS